MNQSRKKSFRVGLVTVFFAWSFESFAEVLKSPLPSTVPGLDIPNSHLLDDSTGDIYRGMRPLDAGDVKDLANLGITDILIFKNETPNESSDEELKDLKRAGIKMERVTKIPFKWKEFHDFKEACEQTLTALELLRGISKTPNRKIFFHCTVGEDRTGLLSGLYRMLYQNWTINQAFEKEMCARGYAEGNWKKPKHVVDSIHEYLTPLYVRMAFKIQKGFVTIDHLDRSQCAIDPKASTQYAQEFEKFERELRCKSAEAL